MADYLLKTEPVRVFLCRPANRRRKPFGTASPIPSRSEISRGMQSGDRLIIYETGDHKTAVGTPRSSPSMPPIPRAPR